MDALLCHPHWQQQSSHSHSIKNCGGDVEGEEKNSAQSPIRLRSTKKQTLVEGRDYVLVQPLQFSPASSWRTKSSNPGSSQRSANMAGTPSTMAEPASKTTIAGVLDGIDELESLKSSSSYSHSWESGSGSSWSGVDSGSLDSEGLGRKSPQIGETEVQDFLRRLVSQSPPQQRTPCKDPIPPPQPRWKDRVAHRRRKNLQARHSRLPPTSPWTH